VTGRVWWALLALILLIVAGRTLLAAQEALRPTVSRGDIPAGRERDNPVAGSARIDSLLAAVSTPPRNPLAAPAPPPGPARGRGAAVPAVEPPPRVLLLVEDVGGTIVQIEVGGPTSGRMTVGSTFQGWTVQGITPAGVAVLKGNRQLLLPRP
jgi:hypothetical protein